MSLLLLLNPPHPPPPANTHAQVEYPDGRTTLCLLPSKFHKKFWIKRGTFLIIEAAEGVEDRISGQIVGVLYEAHVKRLKRMEGVW